MAPGAIPRVIAAVAGRDDPGHVRAVAVIVVGHVEMTDEVHPVREAAGGDDLVAGADPRIDRRHADTAAIHPERLRQARDPVEDAAGRGGAGHAPVGAD